MSDFPPHLLLLSGRVSVSNSHTSTYTHLHTRHSVLPSQGTLVSGPSGSLGVSSL